MRNWQAETSANSDELVGSASKMADYAFRLRSPRYGGQVGSNPPYGLTQAL